MTLTTEQFTGFYTAVHGNPPFAWQTDLVKWVLAKKAWPELIDVPTGLGKTSMIDVAVFIAAATAHERSSSDPGAGWVGRRRCFFVVDRRLVVDEAAEHARKLAEALTDVDAQPTNADNEKQKALRPVADGLRALNPGVRLDGSRVPLLPVTTMRGGATWDANWVDRPDQPGIVLGTVDQVGSRLFFRGYGVSRKRRPIDAALVGTDSLILIDEAHLATALLTTMTAAHDRETPTRPLQLPGATVVRLSATDKTSVGSDGTRERVFALDPGGHTPERGQGVAHERLHAAKTLIPLTSTPKTVVADLATAALALAGLPDKPARSAAGTPAPRTPAGDTHPAVLVVCNTIDRARAVHTALTKAVTSKDGDRVADVDLLIGRSRPVDRAELVERALPPFHQGDRRRAERPAVLVATQTVEVGVNLDADGLVTESASWDAVVQRLGRLNRFGHHRNRFPAQSALAVVVHDGQADGPVYGPSRDITWTHLTSLVAPADSTAEIRGILEGGPSQETPRGGLDVSPLACGALAVDVPAEARMQHADPPLLLPAVLDAWTRTNPEPANDPPLDAYLHGFDAGAPAVTIVWRSGLLDGRTSAGGAQDDDGISARLRAADADLLLRALPVRTEETVEIPLHVARAWIKGEAVPPASDLDSAPETESRPKHERQRIDDILVKRPAGPDGPDITGRGGRREGHANPDDDAWRWLESTDNLRPGDTIVVPTEAGGLDSYGWNPTQRGAVRDVAELASLSARRPALRLDDGLAERLELPEPAATTLTAAIRAARDRVSDEDTATAWVEATHSRRSRTLRQDLADALDAVDGGWKAAFAEGDPRGRLVEWLRSEGPELNDFAEDPDGRAIWILRGGMLAEAVNPAEQDDETLWGTSLASQPVTLQQHHQAVGDRAQEIATALGLPAELVALVGEAGRLHDLGKNDNRFQVMLHGGDPVEAVLADEPLAKSGIDPSDVVVWRRARRESGLPRGARHEAWSTALAEQLLTESPDRFIGDRDLLLHLIASHHGHSRPLLPLVVDDAPRTIEATSPAGPNGEAKVAVDSALTVRPDHPETFARLNETYGRWGLALLEAIVRCADMTISAEGS